MNEFKGDIVRDSKALEEHSKDASAFKVVPAAVLYPKDSEDIKAALEMVRKERITNPELSLSVRAGGTCMSGGSLSTGYILNLTKYMDKIEIDPHARTAVVEMGAYFRDIEKAAAKHGLMFAPYTSSHLICGIGGMIGNNASGEKSIRYGATIDNVLDLEVILADGSTMKTGFKSREDVAEGREKELLALYDQYGSRLEEAVGNVPKAASGYRLERVANFRTFDATPVFVGAQGTIGIVTKATLKLVPLPAFTRLLIISIDSIHDMPFVLQTIVKHNPEGVETFDINTFDRARVHNADDAKKIEHAVHETTSSIILAQFSEETAEDTDMTAETCMEELRSHHINVQYVKDPEIAAAAWRIRRAGYLLMRDYNEAGFKAVPCIEDVIVPVGSFDIFIEGLVPLMKKHDIKYGFHGHIGDGALRIIPVFNFNDPQVADKIISFMHDVFALVKSVRGNMSADHGDGIIRSPFLKEFYGEELYQVFAKIKNLFDPEGIFNPHKKIGGTEDHIREWLDR